MKKKMKFVAFVLLALCSVGMKAQYRSIEKVYLSNGSVLTGEVIQEVPNKTLDLRMFSMDTVHVNIKQIDSLRYLSLAPKHVRIHRSDVLMDENGKQWEGRLTWNKEKDQYSLVNCYGDVLVFESKNVAGIKFGKRKKENKLLKAISLNMITVPSL